jgi:hypothetical protein
MTRWNPQYGLLFGGLAFLFAALVFTYTGKAWDRYSGWVCLAKEPGRFWREIAMYCLCGLCLMGYFFYRYYLLPH